MISSQLSSFVGMNFRAQWCGLILSSSVLVVTVFHSQKYHVLWAVKKSTRLFLLCKNVLVLHLNYIFAMQYAIKTELLVDLLVFGRI